MTEKTRKKTTPVERLIKFVESGLKKASKFEAKFEKAGNTQLRDAFGALIPAFKSATVAIAALPPDFGVKGSTGRTNKRQPKLVAGDKVTLISKKVAKFGKLYPGIDLANITVVNQEGSTVRVSLSDGSTALMSRKVLLAPGEVETVEVVAAPAAEVVTGL